MVHKKLKLINIGFIFYDQFVISSSLFTFSLLSRFNNINNVQHILGQVSPMGR